MLAGVPPEKIIGTKLTFYVFDIVRKNILIFNNFKLSEAHGSFQSAYCTQCGQTYDLRCLLFQSVLLLNRDLTVSAKRRWLKREIFSPETNDEVPKCEKCQGVVRPDVVLFGRLIHLFQG